MKRSDYKYLHISNYLDLSLHDLIFQELTTLSSESIIINQDGSITKTTENNGHIRNNRIEDDIIDQLLTPGIKQHKDITKKLMKEQGMLLPVVRGVLNYHNPKSMKWHKDFVPPEMDTDPKKRVVTFYVASKQNIDAMFMVSPNSDGPGIWNLGFKINLEPNMLIAHNQNLGHEYIDLGTKNINILSMLWYDMG